MTNRPTPIHRPASPTSVCSTRTDLFVNRLPGGPRNSEVVVLAGPKALALTGLEAVELFRALAAVLTPCGYCGQPCEATFCGDRDCERHHRGSEATIVRGRDFARQVVDALAGEWERGAA